MPRLARLVVPGLPHHVTQRGNRRERVFFSDEDYRIYRDLIFESAEKSACAIWCWCLMPNHVHFILVPSDENGLRKTFAEAHRQYTRRINLRLAITGHLWQGRFGSVVMDEAHLYHAARYVSLNPVRAGLVAKPQDWRWSSVRDHLEGRSWRAFDANAVLERYGDFAAFLGMPERDADYVDLRKAENSGRPLGSKPWVGQLERHLGLRLAPQRPGPKRKQ
ncbi:MAG: transposase [Nitratireductor sp.]|nr:transposase [Nitratireductor sp.]